MICTNQLPEGNPQTALLGGFSAERGSLARLFWLCVPLNVTDSTQTKVDDAALQYTPRKNMHFIKVSQKYLMKGNWHQKEWYQPR